MKRVLLLLLGLAVSGLLIGQTSLSLSEAIALGLKNNYQIQISERNLEVAQNNNSWGAAGRYPTVDFNVNLQNSITDQNNPAAFINGAFFNGGATANLDVRWVLFDGYRVRINKERFEELERQNQGNIAIAVENSIRSIMLAYYQVLIQQEQLAVLGEVLDLSRDRVNYQEVRQEFGQAGSFELLQSQDALLNDSTSLLIQENSLDIALRNLNLAMGEDDLATRYTLSDPLNYPTENYQFEDLQQRLFTNNKNLQNLFIARSISNIESKAANSARYPTVSVNTGASATGNFFKLWATNPSTGEPFEPATGSNLNYYLNFSATYNLYNGGATKRGIENAKVQELVAQLNIEDLKRNLSTQLANTLANYDNQKALIALTEELINNARQNLTISEERFRGGQINSFDYRAVQLAYINASQSRLNAIFNLKNTETELIQLIGGLVR